MDHLAEQSVLDFVNGALAEQAASVAHAHLDRCRECRAVIAGVIRGDATEVIAAGSEPSTRGDAPHARRAAPVPAGERLDEYELAELLGRGGMGSVYRARDTLLDREVAIKLIARTSSEQARQRFVVEARAVARIRHPNVVVVHRVGIANEQPFIVYALVRGRTLEELARPLPWPKVLQLAVGMARGLAAAHACGVLHRDIKPANVMLDEHGDVVLVDFGLAKLDGRADDPPGTPASDPSVTAPGVALGTPRYMAPESWRGGSASAQTDVFSFGLVLHELLAGRVPFADTGADELAHRVCNEDAPPLASAAPWVPPVLGALVDRCIAREPARRPASAAELAAELEALQRGRAFEAFESDRVRRVPPGNPYPGAHPFGIEHQGVLYGRRDELRALVDQLRERPFVVIAGEAGAGKTSLCLAGVLPIVWRGALGGARCWVPVPLVPGPHPIAALATALAPHLDDTSPDEVARGLVADPTAIVEQFRAGHRGGCTAHVLFVDQLEDLVTVSDRDEAVRFSTLLGMFAEPAPAMRLLATVRAPHLLAVAQLPGLSAAIGRAIYLLLEPRDPGALRDIIVEPARLSGRAVDDATLQPLVRSASRGELPLRELASRLAELWPRLPALVR